ETGAMMFRATPTFWIGLPLLGMAIIAVGRQGTGFGDTDAPRATRLAIVVAVVMALLQQRHFALAALLSSAVLGMWLTRWCQKWPDVMHRVRGRAAVLITAMVLMLLAYGYPARMWGSEMQWRKPGSGFSTMMPRSPVSILARQWQVTGTVLCEYEFGSIVVHASGGLLQPTMDSRNTVYGADRYLDHRNALNEANPEQDRLLAMANAVMIRPPESSRQQLTRRLATDDIWALLHVGPRCQLWVRRTAVPENLRPSLTR
ncbi:MAG: hypothetical protein VX404_02405, partial [Planctomycetota bacterium]|nr:hypothetical protein [Planctomycetota bacterium]